MKQQRERECKGEGVYNSSYSCCSDVFLAEPVWHTLHFLSFAPSHWTLIHLLSSSQPNTFCIPKNLLLTSMKNIYIWACREYKNQSSSYTFCGLGLSLNYISTPSFTFSSLYRLSFHTLSLLVFILDTFNQTKGGNKWKYFVIYQTLMDIILNINTR